MPGIKTTTIPEQVAVHLRSGISSGRWTEIMPGRDSLATELGVSPRSVQKALMLLEKERLLEPQGKGKPYKINRAGADLDDKPIRVGLLVFDRADHHDDYVLELRHQLEDAGHISVVPREGLHELGMDVNRVAKLVRKASADAWVVVAGSRELLEWFIDKKIKVFALAGRRFSLPIAGTGPDKSKPYREVVHELATLGHRRIVLLVQRQLRLPEPSFFTRAFVNALEDAGVPTGQYNLPDWEDNAEGFQEILESLFRTTPPTALVLDEPFLFHAAYHFLAQKQLRVPQDVSLVCTDGSNDFFWCKPSVAHLSWDYQTVIRRIMKWVKNVARGKDDRRQTFTKAVYVRGGTVGPAPD